MNKQISVLFVCALICVCLISPVSYDTAYAATKTSDALKDATINIYCHFKKGSKSYSTSGSGVFISERGVILTNAHVAQYFLVSESKEKVRGACSIRTGSPAKDQYTASVLYLPVSWIETRTLDTYQKTAGVGQYDFALLYITGAKKGEFPVSFPTIPLATKEAPAEGSIVSIAGYPTEKLKYDAVRRKLKMLITESTVSAVSGFIKDHADVATIASSPAGSNGISGGPVINSNGQLSAIITSKSAAKNDRTTRAITLSYIQNIVRSETGQSLTALLQTPFAPQALLTRSRVPAEVIATVTKDLLQ